MRPKYMSKISYKSKSTYKKEVIEVLRNGLFLSILQGVLIGIVLGIADLDLFSAKGLTVFFLILACGFLGQLKNQS